MHWSIELATYPCQWDDLDEARLDACQAKLTASGYQKLEQRHNGDQVRFEAALSICAPGLEILAPVRDEMPSRDDQRAWLESNGHPLPPLALTTLVWNSAGPAAGAPPPRAPSPPPRAAAPVLRLCCCA